jgi:Thiol-disulfide isomerase and thioredoxins
VDKIIFMKCFFTLAIILLTFAFASAQNEQAPVVDKQFDYKNWSYNDVRGGDEINLRKFAQGKKLVMVVYFAPWCPNWRHEAPFAEKLYEKYKANGFDVIGISEYDTANAAKTNLDELKITFPVVYESQSRDDREKTLHSGYRKETGDTRKWGSPWNVFLLPSNIQNKGDVLTAAAPVVNGELIEADAEKFVREKLGLPPEEQKAVTTAKKEIETCDPDTKTTTLKKPNQ